MFAVIWSALMGAGICFNVIALAEGWSNSPEITGVSIGCFVLSLMGTAVKVETA